MSNTKINRFTFIILLIFNSHVFSQPTSDPILSKTDSLKALLSGSKTHEQVDILNELASIYAPLNFDSAITYAVRAQRIGSVYGYPLGVGKARLYTGNAYYYKMDLKNALLSYLASLKILEEYKSLEQLGELFMQLGNINYYMGRTEKAISYFRLAGENYRSSGNFRESLQEPFAIFFTYLMHQQLDSALVYCNRFVKGSRELNDRYMEAHGLNPMGWIYMEMDDIDRKQKALQCFYSSLEIGTELNDEILICTNNLCLGNYYDRSTPLFEVTGNLKLARVYHERALEAAEKANNSFLQAAVLDYLAAIDLEEKKYDQADKYLVRSAQCLDIFLDNPVKNVPVSPYLSFGKMVDYILVQRERIVLYGLRYDLALAKGGFIAAIHFLKLQNQYQDSMYSEQQAHQFELIMAEAEAEKTDQKIRSLAQENELNQLRLSRSRYISAGIASLLIIIILFLLLFFQRKKLKAEQKSISLEQRLLRAQMNPHFLFNSLASIQNYIINEESDQASIYLSRFSQLVRNILDNSMEEYVPLDKEIETVENYLELQKVRFAGKFDYNIEIDPDIDTENTLIPPMLAQPFIENAIDHGIRHKSGSGHIEIRFLLEDGFIRFEVEDDGVGREKAREIESSQGRKHRSMATSITTDRLESINRRQKKKIRLEITDLKDAAGNGCGTRVRFGIPVGILLFFLALLEPSCRQDRLPEPPEFHAYEGNPILSPGEPGSWDNLFVWTPRVIVHEGTYYMYYLGGNVSGRMAIGLAESKDGIRFAKVSHNPVLSPDDEGFDAYTVGPGIVIQSDSGWLMYYNAQELRSFAPGRYAGRATAPSPEGPWKRSNLPVLTSGITGEWDAGFIIPSSVIRMDDGGFMMFYSGGNDLSKFQDFYIGMATSADGITWTKYNDPLTTQHPFSESDPVMMPGKDGEWDDCFLWMPYVTRNADGYHMYYGASDENRRERLQAMGYATSEDGLHWTRYPGNPVYSVQDDPFIIQHSKAGYMENPCVLCQDSLCFMYYEFGLSQIEKSYIGTAVAKK